MITSYSTIMLNHLEQMQFEVAAAAETLIGAGAGEAEGSIGAADCTKFVCVTAGEGSLSSADGEEELKPGTCAVILPGAEISLQAEPEAELVVKWCHLHIKHGNQDVYKMLRLPDVFSFASAEAEGLLDKMIRSLGQQAAASRLRVKAAALELLSLYLELLPAREEADASGDASAPQEMAKIETVLRYIDEHLGDNITVEELARLVYLHPNYFIVFFKTMLGCSPIQYVNQRRMETAKALLLDPDCSISEVADRIGLKIYYFSRMFKAHTGLTPSRYRKLAAGRTAAEQE